MSSFTCACVPLATIFSAPVLMGKKNCGYAKTHTACFATQAATAVQNLVWRVRTQSVPGLDPTSIITTSVTKTQTKTASTVLEILRNGYVPSIHSTRCGQTSYCIISMHYYGCTCAKALRQPEPQAGILANVGEAPELVGILDNSR